MLRESFQLVSVLYTATNFVKGWKLISFVRFNLVLTFKRKIAKFRSLY
jgi:hypothetical protein